MSLGESWPSTEMRSNERLTHTPVSSSSVAVDMAASVSTKQNMVAKRGEIMPAPLAWPASRTRPPGSDTSRQARFGPLSLVRMACEKSPESGPSCWQAWRTPASTRSRGSSCPITPVEATATRSGSMPSGSAAVACMARAVSSPRRPSPTLEQPEFATTARSPSSRASCVTITGAPMRALLVKRAAEAVSSESERRTPTSSPSGLMPAATPAARKPAGSAVGSSSRACAGRSTQRERKKLT
jgi:hypothetical protein